MSIYRKIRAVIAARVRSTAALLAKPARLFRRAAAENTAPAPLSSDPRPKLTREAMLALVKRYRKKSSVKLTDDEIGELAAMAADSPESFQANANTRRRRLGAERAVDGKALKMFNEPAEETAKALRYELLKLMQERIYPPGEELAKDPKSYKQREIAFDHAQRDSTLAVRASGNDNGACLLVRRDCWPNDIPIPNKIGHFETRVISPTSYRRAWRPWMVPGRD